MDYVRNDNWRALFALASANGNTDWVNLHDPNSKWIMFPALDPDHLYPFDANATTGGGTHGFVDTEGFVRVQKEEYTGWRAINFSPTPFLLRSQAAFRAYISSHGSGYHAGRTH